MPKKLLAPPSRDDFLRVVAMRLPDDVIGLVDRIGRRQIRSRSDVLRALTIEALQARGLIETADAILEEVA